MLRVRSVAIFLAVLLLAWLGLALFLYFVQDRMLFFPTREIGATPARIGLQFEEVTLPLENGRELGAWFVPAREARGTLLFCHGNAGNISHRLESIREFHGHGLNVFIFDYEGYGRSTGTPSEAALYRDAEAAWRHLIEARGVAPAEIVLFGRSLGGGVAAWLGARVQAAGLIVESAFTSVPDMARELYPWLALRFLVRNKVDALAAVRGARCPVLVAHSREDEIVPFAHGQRIFAAAPEPKEFLELRGDHNSGFLVTGQEYSAGLGRFFEHVLPRRDSRR